MNTVWLVDRLFIDGHVNIGFFKTEQEAVDYCKMKNKIAENGVVDECYFCQRLRQVEVYE